MFAERFKPFWKMDRVIDEDIRRKVQAILEMDHVINQDVRKKDSSHFGKCTM